eukprot:RCo015309
MLHSPFWTGMMGFLASSAEHTCRSLGTAATASTAPSCPTGTGGASKPSAVKGSFLLKAPAVTSDAARIVADRNRARGIVVRTAENEKLGRQLIAARDKQMGPNVSVFYKQDGGLVVPEGRGCYLIDVDGNKHLDCCNNVACVGHSHPAVVAAGQRELGRIVTNSRFLNEIQQRYLAKLLATLPPELNAVYLCNSGSEANDLALRIARSHTTAAKPRDVICLDYAYHGHTQATMDVSPYKWAQATNGLDYKPSSTHVVSCPDSYRGKYRGHTPETGMAYAREVQDIVLRTGGVGAFIAESIVGCGGQVVLPPSYLQHCYDYVRGAGGVVIADEVQTGFARIGTHFWAFQAYGVVPDIVTMGKPMANGFPMAAVVCRREIAESFASSGIEYFNTYGGNSLACAIAEAVLDTIAQEGLQSHALEVGEYLHRKLLPLRQKYTWVGDLRGMGLFRGVEFVRSNSAEDPLPYPDLTKFVVDYLRYINVIISRDGPDENVIKIKPPLVFGVAEADQLVAGIEEALAAAQASGKY